MQRLDIDAVVAELEREKAKDARAAGDLIRNYPEADQPEIAKRLGYAIGMTRAGRSFRLINPRKTVVTGTAGIIFDDDDHEILLQQRWGTNGLWEPCGGGLKHGEAARDNVMREALEETGLVTEITGYIGLFSNPKPDEILVYPDGEERHCVVNIFALKAIGGVLTLNKEVDGFGWFNPQDALNLPMLPIHKRLVEMGVKPGARQQWPIID